MKPITFSRRRSVSIVATLIIAAGVLVGCANNQPAAITGSTTPTVSTNSKLPVNEPTKQAAQDDANKNEQPRATDNPLPTLPPRTPGPPAETPYPTPTLIMGMLPRCNTASAIPYVLNSCWRGYVSSDIVNVGAGRINNADGSSYGAIVVRIGFGLTFFNHDNPPVDVYQPPTSVDEVQIVAVNGTVFTIAPVSTPPNDTWFFDLSTRQWLNAAGTPLPTLTPAPTVEHKQ